MKDEESKIDLVRAAFRKQFTDTMLANQVNPAKYYRMVGLPTIEPTDLESLLPEKPFWRLINIVAREENVPNFGAQVAKRFPWHKVESLAAMINQCTTLGELLTTFCDVASKQSSHVQFNLDHDRNASWFSASALPLIRNDEQMEFYRVSSMIQLVQLATGSKWRPNNVQLFLPPMETGACCPLLRKSNVTFENQQTSIDIPDVVLNFPVSIKIPNININLDKYDINANFIDSLRLILDVYLIHQEYKIEAIAQAIGIPVRTLQYRLKLLGTSFNELMSEAKFKFAKEKLTRSSKSIKHISGELGYSDDAHFGRAFKHWSGMTPGEFRKVTIN